MEFRCEDLPQHGVVLVPPTSPEYDTLLADIVKRTERPVEGSPPLPPGMRPRIVEEDRSASAILLNRAPVGIAAIYQVWTLQEANRPASTSSIGGGVNPSVLLPFGLPAKQLKLYGYWQVILPGSKRYLTAAGEQAGDNSDVRPPGPNEVWTGGVAGSRGGGGHSYGPLEKVTLTLDGVFFTDGGFAGPNRRGLWEQVVFSAEAHQEVAAIARRGHDAGQSFQSIFADIRDAVGPRPDGPVFPPHRGGSPEAFRSAARAMLAWKIGSSRQMTGDERTVYTLMGWAGAPVPQFRKL